MQFLHGKVDALDIGSDKTGRSCLLRDSKLYAQRLVINDVNQGPADEYDAAVQQITVVAVEDL